MSRLTGDAVVSVLSSALEDRSPRVRSAVVAGLGELGNEAVVPQLAARLSKDKDQFVRKAAAYALGRFHSSERTTALISALRDRDLEVRGAAAVSLSDHAEAAAVSALESSLSDKSAFVRAQAARALGVSARLSIRVVPSLITRLGSDEDAEVKRQAATALGLIGDRSAFPALERAKHDKDPYLAQAALEAIGAIEARK